jgi:hypothetical protein
MPPMIARRGAVPGRPSEYEKTFVERIHDQGFAEGKAEGKAEGVPKLLDARHLAPSRDQRQQVTSCTDAAQLERVAVACRQEPGGKTRDRAVRAHHAPRYAHSPGDRAARSRRRRAGAFDTAARLTRRAAAADPRLVVTSSLGFDVQAFGMAIREYHRVNPWMPRARAAVRGWQRADTMIRAGDADAALLRTPFDPTGLDTEVLSSESQVVLTAKDHRLAGQPRLTVADPAAAGNRPPRGCRNLPGGPAGSRPGPAP